MAVKQKQNKKRKGSAQKYPQTEVNFFLEPKPQETAVWSKAASGADGCAAGSCLRMAPSRGAETLPHGRKPPQTASVWLKKNQRPRNKQFHP